MICLFFPLFSHVIGCYLGTLLIFGQLSLFVAPEQLKIATKSYIFRHET
jgi:hypothetical protein